jgi:hypothetical protein
MTICKVPYLFCILRICTDASQHILFRSPPSRDPTICPLLPVRHRTASIHPYPGQVEEKPNATLRLTMIRRGQVAKADKTRHHASASRRGVGYPLVENKRHFQAEARADEDEEVNKRPCNDLLGSVFACSGITAALHNPVTWTRGGLCFQGSVNSPQLTASPG